jgi:hypothetical protein
LDVKRHIETSIQIGLICILGLVMTTVRAVVHAFHARFS